MSTENKYQYPKLHNATWPGLVGKGGRKRTRDRFETMLDLTAAAEVDGLRFDGVDIFLSLPHTELIRRMTISKGLPIASGRAAWSSARWSLPCGGRLAAVRRWGRRRSARTS